MSFSQTPPPLRRRSVQESHLSLAPPRLSNQNFGRRIILGGGLFLFILSLSTFFLAGNWKKEFSIRDSANQNSASEIVAREAIQDHDGMTQSSLIESTPDEPKPDYENSTELPITKTKIISEAMPVHPTPSDSVDSASFADHGEM